MDTERRVQIDNSEDAAEVVDRLGKLSLSVEAKGESDPFAISASQVKGFSGTDAVFKRRVTNELKKINQNVSGSAKSQKIEDEYSGYDVFGVVSPPYNMDYLAKLYELSAPHYAAVNAKVANIVGLGYKFVETSGTKRLLEEQEGNEKKLKKTRRVLDEHRDDLIELLESFHDEDTFTETLIKVWRDYETVGNGFIEIGRNVEGRIAYVGHIPAATMRVRRNRDGFVQLSGNKVQFFSKFKSAPISDDEEGYIVNPIGAERPNEVIHLKKSSPTNSFYGVPDIVAAKQAIAGNEFASRFNLDYFENKAVPRHLIIMKGARLGANAERDLLQFFETNLKGQNHRSLFIPLPGDRPNEKVDFKIEAIEAGVQDSSFKEFKKGNDKDIMMVHRVPETKVSVSGGVNIAVAKDADKTFKEQVCGPEQKNLQQKLKAIIKEFTNAFELQLNEMTLTDADTQSKIDERDAKIGKVTRNELRARDGMPGIKKGDEIIDINKDAQAKAEATTSRQRDSDRSANAGDANATGRNAKGEGRAQA